MKSENFYSEHQKWREATEANAQELLQKLEEITEKAGYAQISTLEELGLSPEEIKQVRWIKIDQSNAAKDNVRFYSADRDDKTNDKTNAKAIVKPNPTQSNTYQADIFSPAFYQGHGGNHDFSPSELEENLRIAKELEPYPKDSR